MPESSTVSDPTPAFQALVDRYDVAVSGILANPSVAANAADVNVATYLSLFPKDNQFAFDSLKFWVSEGQKGRFYRPGPKGVMFKTAVRKASVISEDLARFTVCSTESITVVDGTGAPIEASGGVHAGTITAVMVNGVWLLRDLSEGSADPCPQPGASG